MSRQPTVLLVEDDPETLDVMASVLHNVGYDVLMAAHENAAIEHLLQHPETAVVITDACFGDGSSGMCMAEAVRRAGSAAVIVITSTNPDAVCITLGDSAVFLLKPYGRKALLDAVTTAIEKVGTTTAGRATKSRFIGQCRPYSAPSSFKA